MTEGTNAKWPHPDWKKYGDIYCGLEAKVTNPENGRTEIMYVTDAFDDKWVRSPASIDIMIGSFEKLKGIGKIYDKNNVIRDVQWEFTGNRNEKYRFQGPGDQ
jgi:phage-related tail protein